VSTLRKLLGVGALAILLLAALGGYGLYRAGSAGALLATLQGQALYIEQARVAVGELRPRQHVTVPVRVRNLTAGSLQLLGSHSGCGCRLAAEGLPVELAAGEVRELTVHFTAPADGPAEFETVVTFYVNVAGEQPQAVLFGHVLPADVGSGSPKSGG
jgi:hypothetical protein